MITIPAAGLVGALASWIALAGIVGILADAAVAVGVIVWIFEYSRRNRVHAHNVHLEPAAFVRPKKRTRDRTRRAAK